MRVILAGLILFLIVLATAILSAKNGQLILLDYLLGELQIRLSHALLLSMLIGIVTGLLLSISWCLVLLKENKKLKKQNKLHAQEVNNLRALPMKDSF